MQQAIYNTITGNGISIQATKTNKTATVRRRREGLGRLVQSWDLAGMLALMASSAAYGVYALAHLGF